MLHHQARHPHHLQWHQQVLLTRRALLDLFFREINFFILISGTTSSSSTNNETSATSSTATTSSTTTKKTTTKRGNKDLEAKLPASAAYELVQASQALQAVQALQVHTVWKWQNFSVTQIFFYVKLIFAIFPPAFGSSFYEQHRCWGWTLGPGSNLARKRLVPNITSTPTFFNHTPSVAPLWASPGLWI